jgi:hypothetical protein
MNSGSVFASATRQELLVIGAHVDGIFAEPAEILNCLFEIKAYVNMVIFRFENLN